MFLINQVGASQRNQYLEYHKQHREILYFRNHQVNQQGSE
jgi:hypothetical protein